jgi:hypothetical protein
MKMKLHPGATSDFKSGKPLTHHGVGRERRRLIVDEGTPYSHNHPEWPSIPTMFERDHFLTHEAFAVPHHAFPSTEDALRQIVHSVGQLATQLASTPVVLGMMRALRENVSAKALGDTEEPFRARVEHRLASLEDRVARLEGLAAPRSGEPDSGDPFEAFQDLRKALGEEKFRWIVADE